jgi:phytoene dehydrogenase-like protein/ferredoxin
MKLTSGRPGRRRWLSDTPIIAPLTAEQLVLVQHEEDVPGFQSSHTYRIQTNATIAQIGYVRKGSFGETMHIDRDKCTGCGYCVLACPFDALTTDGWAYVLPDQCTDCNVCYYACPNQCFLPNVPLRPPVRRYRPAYDAVVIGAGIGGLMAAAWLARHGRQVAVFEQLGFLGGRYTEIDYHGYKCSTGAWTPLGPKSHIGRFLAEVGAEVEWISLRDRGNGPLSRYRFRDGREAGSPLDLLDRAGQHAYLKMLIDGRRGAPSDASALEYVSEYADHPDLLAAIDATVATASGLHADVVPASEFIQITLDTHDAGQDFAYPVGGTRTLIKALSRVIRACGGSIFPRTPVQRIAVEDGTATGLVLNNGDYVAAGTVLHNAGPRRLTWLAGREHFPTGYLARLDRLVPADCAAVSVGTTEPLWTGVPMLLTPGCDRVVGIFEPTFFDPGVAPPGHHLYDVFFPLHSPDRAAELALARADLRALFPHFDRALDLWVSQFFTGAWTGTESGQTFGQVGEARLAPATPTRNLYLVGMDVQGSGVAGDVVPIGVRRLLAALQANIQQSA